MHLVGSRRVRILIRCNRTNHYFAGDGQWTPFQQEALDCIHSRNAMRIIRRESLQRVALVVVLDDGRETSVVRDDAP